MGMGQKKLKLGRYILTAFLFNEVLSSDCVIIVVNICISSISSYKNLYLICLSIALRQSVLLNCLVNMTLLEAIVIVINCSPVSVLHVLISDFKSHFSIVSTLSSSSHYHLLHNLYLCYLCSWLTGFSYA